MTVVSPDLHHYNKGDDDEDDRKSDAIIHSLVAVMRGSGEVPLAGTAQAKIRK